MENLITALLSLIESGKNETEKMSDASKIEAFQLARDVRKLVKPAMAELAKLSPEQKDELAFRTGLKINETLGA